MRKLIATIVLLAVIDTSVAVAQTVGLGNSSAPPPQSTNPDSRLLPAPVGHRQPRVDQVPDDEQTLVIRTIQSIAENAALFDHA